MCIRYTCFFKCWFTSVFLFTDSNRRHQQTIRWAAWAPEDGIREATLSRAILHQYHLRHLEGLHSQLLPSKQHKWCEELQRFKGPSTQCYSSKLCFKFEASSVVTNLYNFSRKGNDDSRIIVHKQYNRMVTASVHKLTNIPFTPWAPWRENKSCMSVSRHTFTMGSPPPILSWIDAWHVQQTNHSNSRNESNYIANWLTI